MGFASTTCLSLVSLIFILPFVLADDHTFDGDSMRYDIVAPGLTDGEKVEALKMYNIECIPESPILRFSVDYLSGGTIGYYVVEGCEGINPTLVLTKGTEYVFDQMTNITNWMHPLGFAYYPDGAHGWLGIPELPELESPTPDLCDLDEFQCNPGYGVLQAPLYDVNGNFDSLYDWNNPDVTGAGLDVYEPMFQTPIDQWIENESQIRLTFPIDSLTKNAFYFCHVHAGMSAEIILMDPKSSGSEEKANSNTLQIPFIPETYYVTQSAFDAKCGTAGVNDFALTEEYCPEQIFLCNDSSQTQFVDCMAAIDCQMRYEMTTSEYVDNPLVTFMHQMIPHHQNAVNMVKIVLAELTRYPGVYEGVNEETMFLLYEILAAQSKQIQYMNSWLKEYGVTPENCAEQPLNLDIFGTSSED